MTTARLIFLLCTLAWSLAPAAGAQATAARRIARGAVLTAADVRQVAGDTTRAVGLVARRVIQAGEPLVAPAVMPAPAIRSGDTVQVHLEAAGIELALRGTALADASSGDTILVRLDARRRIRAVVRRAGHLTATP
jgi:flagella basal body P-ring formation protein FlgA